MVARDSFMEVYRQRTYQLAAIIGAAGMAILLVWSSQIVTVFPQGGLFLDVDALTLSSMALAAVLMGITLPLHWFAWRRTRVVAPASGLGVVGTLFSVGSLSCCAPSCCRGCSACWDSVGPRFWHSMSASTSSGFRSWHLPSRSSW